MWGKGSMWSPLDHAEGVDSEALEQADMTDDAAQHPTYIMLDCITFLIRKYEM